MMVLDGYFGSGDMPMPTRSGRNFTSPPMPVRQPTANMTLNHGRMSAYSLGVFEAAKPLETDALSVTSTRASDEISTPRSTTSSTPEQTSVYPMISEESSEDVPQEQQPQLPHLSLPKQPHLSLPKQQRVHEQPRKTETLTLGVKTRDGSSGTYVFSSKPLGFDFKSRKQAPLIVGTIQADSEADRIGLPLGAVIVAINDESMEGKDFAYQYELLKDASKTLKRA